MLLFRLQLLKCLNGMDETLEQDNPASQDAGFKPPTSSFSAPDVGAVSVSLHHTRISEQEVGGSSGWSHGFSLLSTPSCPPFPSAPFY